MYKKFLVLVLAANCISNLHADTPDSSSALFTNPNQMKMDQLASAQQRINFLEHKNRMSKSQMGGALVGGSIIAGGMGGICAAFISDKELKQQVFTGIAVITMMSIVTGSAIMAFGDNTNNPTEEECKEAQELQKYILEQSSK